MPKNISLEKARRILGLRNVFCPNMAAGTWKVARPKRTTIPFTPETIESCAEENKTKESDWCLIYAMPLSLLEQRAIIGTKDTSLVRFSVNEWWVFDRQRDWIESVPGPGYYLVDLKGRFAHNQWVEQEKQISALGEKYVRADERVVSQLMILASRFFGLYPQRWHWGHMETEGGARVVINQTEDLAVRIYACNPVLLDGAIDACISVVPEF